MNKYGIYVRTGAKVDTRMIAYYREDGYEGFKLVGTAKTKAEAKAIFEKLEGNFWN